jgi:hypothetical protein
MLRDLRWAQFTPASAANASMFLAKLDAAGDAVWVKTSEGDAGSFVHGRAVDYAGGYLYLAGSFWQTAWFGSDSLSKNGLYPHTYINKYDLSGNLEWVLGCDSSAGENSASALHAQGNQVIVSGVTTGPTTFDNSTVGDTVFFPLSGYILKLNGLGQVQSSKTVLGDASQSAMVNNLMSDWMGNVYFAQNVFDFSTIDGQTVTGDGFTTGNRTIALGKLDIDGNVDWYKTLGGGDYSFDSALGLSQQGHPFISGLFQGACTFDAIQVTSNGLTEMFLAKLNFDGEAQWVESFGGKSSQTLAENVMSIDLNQSNQVFVLGELRDSDVQVGPYSLTCAPTNGRLIAQFDGTVTAINQLDELENELLVYPNPASNSVTIQLPWSARTVLTIFNAQGQLVMKKEVANQQSVDLALPALRAGLYFVTATTENQEQVATQLVIVE